MPSMRHLTHFIVLVAFVLAAISPACKFVSGDMGGGSLIEICTLEGIKLLPDGRLPPLQNQTQSQDDHKKTFSDCVFCFARDHSKAMYNDVFSLAFALIITLRDASAIDPKALIFSVYPFYQSRAPPV